MVIDSQLSNLPESSDDFQFINEVRTPTPELSPYVGYGLEIVESTSSIDLHNYVFPPSPDFGTLVQSVDDSTEIGGRASDSVFKFLDHILMEENMDEKLSMFHDPLALQATEKSFYDVIDKKYPPPPSLNINIECTKGLCERTCEADENSVQSSFTGSRLLVHSVDSSKGNSGGQIDSFTNMHLIPGIFSHSESVFHFQKGMEEAMKFLPTINELVFDSNKYTLPPISEKDNSTISRGRKHLHHQDSDLDARSRKQSAVYKDEVDQLLQLFNKVLLRDVKGLAISSKGEFKFLKGIDKYWHQNRLPVAPRKGEAPSKKQGVEIDAVYMQSLLLSCAEALASNDIQTVQEDLKQIRQYASSTGDASQRLANVFANGLEARLAGTATQIYGDLTSTRISAADKLEAYHVYRSACPFLEISKSYAYKKILKIAAKTSTIHIVDFGISYGFQWPLLIQFLSIKQGGPPKLRITGIDFPQPGFRPAILVQETGQMLAKYCKHFNVPFEYQAIARERLETISVNDLKLARDESLVVYSQLGLHKFPEEPEVVESPKDGVLKLIRTMKPDLFIHAIANASFNTSLFMTRFREAFFYYSSLFDMHENTLSRIKGGDLPRSFIEEIYGHEVVNIIACEGRQRVVRPETYKQWHIRSLRSGFKILPFDRDLPFKSKAETSYHKDFLFDEDCNWMLLGWKGRVLHSTSCWVPV